MDRMVELEELVNTYGGIVIIKKYQKRFAPHPKTFIGPGKVEELGKEGKKIGAKLVIINDRLKPRQAYEVSEMLRPAGIQVWDRIDLILNIFDKHASTTEAKLEIELASIRHMGPRIFGMGMELLRQAGGIGTRGIGETNTEIMKRHLRERERNIKKKLEKYKKVRATHRSGRKRQNLKTFALVGYTNAGKTTLLNRLTRRKEYAADELFATLDTRVGKCWLPNLEDWALISDTIGFIKHLPPELLNAFASTLSEAVDADFLLHVVDASDEKAHQQLQVVEEILERLYIDKTPRLIVFNKAEGVNKRERDALQARVEELPSVFVSAMTGEGIDGLLEQMETLLEQKIDR